MEKKSEKERRRLGKQAPRYRFFLNPYRDARFNSCPQCGNKTGQKKLPLFIHIDPQQQLLLNKTCRYCAHCDLLIVHQDDLEEIMAKAFTLHPEIAGDTYLVIGTLDRADWKRIMDQPDLPPQASIEALHDFKEAVTFKLMGGWGR